MIKYYCDWCNREIPDGYNIEERILVMTKTFGDCTPFYSQTGCDCREKFLLCDKCISRVATLKKHIKESLRNYDD